MPVTCHYIIAVDITRPLYLHRDTAHPYLAEGMWATYDRRKARVFDTFAAANDVIESMNPEAFPRTVVIAVAHGETVA